jgi:tRNA threonylcarbamoyladenosine biosynthesis protein TsaB
MLLAIMLLAIDSATRVLSLALYDGWQVQAELTWNTPNRHTVELTPAIQELLARAQCSVGDLAVLAVSQGPGSFNGLRIGFSLAKGLAMARGLPLVAIPTLDVLAAAQPPFDGTLIAVLQAGRGRVCAASYRWRAASGWIGQDDVRIVSWASLLDSVGGESLISGEIDADGRALIAASSKPVRLASPALSLRRAGFLAVLAYERWQRGLSGALETLAPIYLHQPGVPHP